LFLRRNMSILKRFKISPSVADPEGLFTQALVVLSEAPLHPDDDLPELPDDIRRIMYREAHYGATNVRG
jgi:hypothetical protein